MNISAESDNELIFTNTQTRNNTYGLLKKQNPEKFQNTVEIKKSIIKTKTNIP